MSCHRSANNSPRRRPERIASSTIVLARGRSVSNSATACGVGRPHFGRIVLSVGKSTTRTAWCCTSGPASHRAYLTPFVVKPDRALRSAAPSLLCRRERSRTPASEWPTPFLVSADNRYRTVVSCEPYERHPFLPLALRGLAC